MDLIQTYHNIKTTLTGTFETPKESEKAQVDIGRTILISFTIVSLASAILTTKEPIWEKAMGTHQTTIFKSLTLFCVLCMIVIPLFLSQNSKRILNPALTLISGLLILFFTAKFYHQSYIDEANKNIKNLFSQNLAPDLTSQFELMHEHEIHITSLDTVLEGYVYERTRKMAILHFVLVALTILIQIYYSLLTKPKTIKNQ